MMDLQAYDSKFWRDYDQTFWSYYLDYFDYLRSKEYNV